MGKLSPEDWPDDTAFRLARYFKTTPEFWMNMQKLYELEVAEDEIAAKVSATCAPSSPPPLARLLVIFSMISYAPQTSGSIGKRIVPVPFFQGARLREERRFCQPPVGSRSVYELGGA